MSFAGSASHSLKNATGRFEATWLRFPPPNRSTLPAAVKSLNVPAFERFLKFHAEGGHSAVARQHRFNRLFIEAQEVFVSRDRENYALNHLNR